MRKGILAIAIAFGMAAPCTVVSAQSFQGNMEIKGIKQGRNAGGTTSQKTSPNLYHSTAKGEHIREGILTTRKAGGDPKTTGKPLTTTVNPALQGNIVLKPQKTDGSLDAAVKQGYDLKANKGR